VRILVVDDHPNGARALAARLREQSYAVDVARDSVTALYKASITDYDTIIVDIRLPDTSIDICRDLRRDGSAVPLLMFTGRDALKDRITALNRGADDCLTRPYAFGELLARLRALLRRGATWNDRPPIVEVGNLRINKASREAFRGKCPIPLTAMEFALLEHLADRTQHIVTRAEIIERVWNVHDDPMSNVIDVYIKRLRRKVDTPGQDSIIRTHRGEGYQMPSVERPCRHGEA
jgi:DNA-binding response OmpR family regulator